VIRITVEIVLSNSEKEFMIHSLGSSADQLQPPPPPLVSLEVVKDFCRKALAGISHKSTGSVVGKVGKMGKLGKFFLPQLPQLPYLPHLPHLLCLLVRNPGLGRGEPCSLGEL